MNRTASSSPLDNLYLMGGLAGIGFVILFIGGIIAQGDSPMYGDSAAEIRAYFADDANRYLLTDWLTGIAAVFFFIPFVLCLRSVLAPVDPTRLWANIAFAGGFAFIILAGASGFAEGAAAIDKGNYDDSTLLVLMGLSAYGFATAMFGLALMTAGAAIVIARSGVLWRWLAIIAGIASVASVVAALYPIEHGDGILDLFNLIGGLGSAIFVLLSSICMLRRRAQQTAGAG